MKNNYILALASAFFFFGSVGVKAQTISTRILKLRIQMPKTTSPVQWRLTKVGPQSTPIQEASCVTIGLTISMTKAQLAASMLLCATVL